MAKIITHEKASCSGNVIFWSAAVVTYSRSRLAKLVQSKATYDTTTIRNANTSLKLAELAKEKPEMLK